MGRFDNNQTAAMRTAFEDGWNALKFSHPAEASSARMREQLASAILSVAAEGVADPKIICQMALRRLPPAAAYYARHVHPIPPANDADASGSPKPRSEAPPLLA
jgi:hypothetical protein